MAKKASNAWDLKDKKWVYWIAVIGFVLSLSFLLWGIAAILYFIYDRNKQKTKNYQIEKVFEKYMLIVGWLGIVMFVLRFII